MKFKIKDRLNGRCIRIWLIFTAVIISLCALMYLVAQQNLRLGANDPQYQLTTDIASELGNGQTPDHYIPSSTTDMLKSLATYIIIFDDSKNVVGSSVSLDNKTPIPPSGVFQYTKEHGIDSFTWEPKSGIRQAVVMERYEGAHPGYVLVGKSIQQTERRELRMLKIIALGGLLTIILSFILCNILLRKF